MSAHDDIAAPETLSAYLDGELSVDRQEELEAHLEQNPESRRRLEAMRRVIDGLHQIEPAMPPPTLEHFVTRQIALERERIHWLKRLEGSFSIFGNRQSPIMMLFGLIIALSLFVYYFAVAVERQRGDSIPVVVGPADQGRAVGERLELAGRVLFWEGEAWHQQRVGAPAREIALATDEGRAWLASHPELEPLADLGEPAVIEVAGEVVRVRPAAGGDREMPAPAGR
ncbi:MAG: hypothetical protein D6696_18255 [Acidobacteria bacterium]|nr:MAG: hypothetical protein D6696_18255 [Acidobacteriota bacterium]